jgi:progressive ankylosis protein
MMAIEGPYVAAIIARLAEPTLNLAAYGVAFSFAFLAEAPIIMVMTAANTLVHDRQSFLTLRRFVYALNGVLTAAILIGLYPPFFRFITDQAIGLPADVAGLTHIAMIALLPWPAAIGYRRFYQGILVRHRMPSRVAYGTIIRLVSMSVAAAALALAGFLPGAVIGAIALSTGVVMEAAASRWMARRVVADLLRGGDSPADTHLTTREIARFYYPLALTSLLAIAVMPLMTFFLGRSYMAIESLAILPVIMGLTFIFRSGAIAYQEVAVALTGPGREHERTIARMAVVLGAAAAFCLGAIAFTPLAGVWFGRISGLPPELAELALWPTRLLVFVPALDYLLTFQRSRFILARRTRVITFATAVEVIVLSIVLSVGVYGIGAVGALAASAAFLVGRLAGSLFLLAAPLPPPAMLPSPVRKVA